MFTPDLYYLGWRDAPHRSLKNRTYEMWDAAGRPAPGSRPGEGDVIGTLRLPTGDEAWKRSQSGMMVPTFDGEPEDGVMWAGESVDVVNDVRPAAEIVATLVKETEAALR